jgi:hypothetical protein
MRMRRSQNDGVQDPRKHPVVEKISGSREKALVLAALGRVADFGVCLDVDFDHVRCSNRVPISAPPLQASDIRVTVNCPHTQPQPTRWHRHLCARIRAAANVVDRKTQAFPRILGEMVVGVDVRQCASTKKADE